MNAPVMGHAAIAQLLNVDAPAARIELYLRLFYSPAAAAAAQDACRERDPAAPGTVEYLRTIDFERLSIERRERLSQLAFYLRRHCAALWSMLTWAETLDLVGRFGDSPDFWIVRGRSLAENFALFVEGIFRRDGRLFHADVARLLGTISGIALSPEKPSPWPTPGMLEPTVEQPQAIAKETFLASYALLDDAGVIRCPSADRLEAARPDGFQVVVWAFSDRSTLVGCSELHRKES